MEPQGEGYAREVLLGPGVVSQMQRDQPTAAEIGAVKTVLRELKTVNHGYRILFYRPETYRLDVGRFRIHYRLPDRYPEGDGPVLVDFIGVY